MLKNLDNRLNAEVLYALRAMGHQVTDVDRPHGGGQAIWIEEAPRVLVGGSEPRKDGLALGY